MKENESGKGAVCFAKGILPSPSPLMIKSARKESGLTQSEAAALIHATRRAWQGWEATESPAKRKMHPAMWELFLMKSPK